MKPRDFKIAEWTPAQWAEHIGSGDDWAALLDGASDRSIDEILAALGHPDGAIRVLACRLVDALGADGLGQKAEQAVLFLRGLVEDDPEADVRAIAADARDCVSELMERRRIEAEMPWLKEYARSRAVAADALDALDDPRPAVRGEVYEWWSNVWSIPSSLRGRVAEKLAARVQAESEPTLRELAQSALERVKRREDQDED